MHCIYRGELGSVLKPADMSRSYPTPADRELQRRLACPDGADFSHAYFAIKINDTVQNLWLGENGCVNYAKIRAQLFCPCGFAHTIIMLASTPDGVLQRTTSPT